MTDIAVKFTDGATMKIRDVEYQETPLGLNIFESETQRTWVPYVNVFCIDFEED